MPASQVDVEHVHDISVFIGQKMQCVVMEVDRRDENVLVSRRKYLQQQQAAARETLFNEIQEGQTRQGVVARVVDFGAFVDMGGADGLLHIRDMSYSRVEKASDIVKEVITQVSVLRGRLGAFERNTLQTNINQLEITTENLTSSESVIRDTDFAEETSNLTRAQILVQAGNSVLAIANAQSQNVLTLLGA